MNIPNIFFEAYKGNEPYLFISYAHKDSERIYPIISILNEMGYNIWYDEGIDPGNEWPEEIAIALVNCAYFLVFISNNSANSKNVINEINFAIDEDKPFLAIHIEEAKLTPGVRLRIGSTQAIMKYRMDSDSFFKMIIRALNAKGLKAVSKHKLEEESYKEEAEKQTAEEKCRTKEAAILAKDNQKTGIQSRLAETKRAEEARLAKETILAMDKPRKLEETWPSKERKSAEGINSTFMFKPKRGQYSDDRQIIFKENVKDKEKEAALSHLTQVLRQLSQKKQNPEEIDSALMFKAQRGRYTNDKRIVFKDGIKVEEKEEAVGHLTQVLRQIAQVKKIE